MKSKEGENGQRGLDWRLRIACCEQGKRMNGYKKQWEVKP
jgi:hypothetical protein